MNQVNKVEIDTALVQRLIVTQFPQWADQPIMTVDSSGTDNAIYRLGEEMAVRLPRVDWAVDQVAKEQRWLPKLASHIPLAIPSPLAMGEPAEGYPWHWSVYRWLEGENATISHVENPTQGAETLAQFIASLQQIDSSGGPAPGPHNSERGVPLAMRDEPVKRALASLKSALDTGLAAEVWRASLEAPMWNDAPRWLHGDLHPGNLLVHRGKLSAVIDFGTLGVGDPACDLMVAWTFLSANTRHYFRSLVGVDDATWIRGRGWALSFGLIAYAYYIHSNPGLAAISRRTIDEVLADCPKS